MKLKYARYKHTTPKTQTVRSQFDLRLGDGFDQLLKLLAKFIAQRLGILYFYGWRHA